MKLNAMDVPWILWLILGTLNFTEGLRLRRVIGGKVVGIQHAKFMVQLLVVDATGQWIRYLCGGALIKRDWVLTAAHCIQKSYDNDLRVLGNTEVRDGIDYRGAVMIRKSYTPTEMRCKIGLNDVALLKLVVPLSGPNITTIDFDSVPVPAGAQLDLYGWGCIETGVTSSVLRHGKLLTMSNEMCQSLFPNLNIEEAMICTGQPTKCAIAAGDSGSPLLLNNKIVAVVSMHGTRETMVGVSMRIEHFADWIKATIAGGYSCTLL